MPSGRFLRPANRKKHIMSVRLIHGAAHLLMAAGLACGAMAAQAASGYIVTQQQETMVSPGMSMDQVRQVLGHPERAVHYGNEPGTTYTYRVRNQEQTLFDVDFTADGQVLKMNERMDPEGGGGHSGRGGGHH